MVELQVILVEPVVPENVGAAARALKTMGFQHLRLVNSSHHRDERAGWLAHGSADILEQAQSFPDLASAIADLDLSIATSAKPRHGRRRNPGPAELRELIAAKGHSIHKVGLVFGREDQGLSNEEIALCDLTTAIPLAAPYPSLNLAQAVMLYAWELSALHPQAATAESEPVQGPTDTQYRALRQRVDGLLQRLEKVPDSKLYDWAMESLGLLAEKDVHFLHTLCQSLERALPAKGSD